MLIIIGIKLKYSFLLYLSIRSNTFNFDWKMEIM